ncbi:hypothetical protein V6N13_110205 [Hibiscus sabdariffa]|uniref:Protein kinase domain-containing protein n=1 Tax=Hibiscus sabdariffa TaxID=183260 RepID=A0ABR2AEL6_9ROSI
MSRKHARLLRQVPAYYEEPLPENTSYETVLKMQESGFRMRWSVEVSRLQGQGSWMRLQIGRYRFFSINVKQNMIIMLNLYIYTLLLQQWALADSSFCHWLSLLSFSTNTCLPETKKTAGKILHRFSRPFTPERFNYTDILSMSNNFKDKLGQGCFGTVYKGQLPDDCTIAVKKLESIKVGEEHFIDRVSRNGQIRHPNLVPILGFCSEGSKHVLVNKYMPNGSLDKYIFSDGGNPGLFSWEKISEIVMGTGRGIEFLHGRSDGDIVHLDIKASKYTVGWEFQTQNFRFRASKIVPEDARFHAIVWKK